LQETGLGLSWNKATFPAQTLMKSRERASLGGGVHQGEKKTMIRGARE